ncbi:MAG: glycosyltransferase family 2 protein [Clostridiales bacterium]|nr:glycosyltransferase family 2 protein [Clostridiales bacterium]
MQKLLSVAIPCYNSRDYMRHAIESVLPGKDRVEIIVVDDGSVDDTAAIGNEYAKRYPNIVRVVRKENGGHGDAVMAGLKAATGIYFRVLDSDDWFDKEALLKLLDVLERMCKVGPKADLVITNYVYEKPAEAKQKQINYRKTLPEGRIFGWDEVGKFATGSYILMHAATYRTQLVRDCNMTLPKHTFYVDHLYVCHPMTRVETIYYLDADLYRYFIGREDQSVNEKVMLSRMDQQVKVNRLMLYDLDLNAIDNETQRKYMYYYAEIVTLATVSFFLRAGTKDDEYEMESFLSEIKQQKPQFYEWITDSPFFRHPIRPIAKWPKWISYPLFRLTYLLVRRLFCFN